LLGKVGDRINALLSGAAWNLKKLWRHFVEHPLLNQTTRDWHRGAPADRSRVVTS
jgi:hypothetical protein